MKKLKRRKKKKKSLNLWVGESRQHTQIDTIIHTHTCIICIDDDNVCVRVHEWLCINKSIKSICKVGGISTRVYSRRRN